MGRGFPPDSHSRTTYLALSILFPVTCQGPLSERCVQTMLQDLGWERLKERRKASRLIVLHMIPNIRRTKHLSAQFRNTLTLVTVSGTVHRQEHKKIEAVQRRAGCWVVNRHRQTSSVNDMYDQLKWSYWWLDAHRRRACCFMTFFKFHRGEVVVNTTRKPIPGPPSRSTRSTDAEAYLLPACRTQYRQKSFFPRTIVEWNALPLSHWWQFNQPWWRPSKTGSNPPPLPPCPPTPPCYLPSPSLILSPPPPPTNL